MKILLNNKLKIKKLRFNKINFLILFLLLTSFFLLRAKINAQEIVRTITITPPTVSVIGNPGYSTEGTMGITNDSDVPVTFNAEINDFIVQDNTGTPEILPANTLMTTYSAAAWIGVTPQIFTIQPKKRQNLNYFIQIPNNAKPGGHYAAVMFVPVNKDTVENTGPQINGQIGTLFSIAVNGPIKENASITKFFINGLQEYGPVNILSQIKNYGDLHIKPIGYITVTDMLGKKTTLQLKENNIFPQAGRDYENEFTGKYMIGRFKAELLASYGVNSNLSLLSTAYFWVFPWKIVLITTLVIIAIILGLIYFKKNGFKKPVKKTQAKKELTSEAPEIK